MKRHEQVGWIIQFTEYLMENSATDIQEWILKKSITFKTRSDVEKIFYNTLQNLVEKERLPTDKSKLFTNLITLYESSGSLESFETYETKSVGEVETQA